MSYDAKQLMELLPAIYRIRDAELAFNKGLQRGPLDSLMGIVAEQLALVEDNIEQSYDDLFIETCNTWVIPYIGDLIAYQGLHEKIAGIETARQAVGHKVALRRRKGTIVVLEQLARDVSGWHATAVEFFQQLSCTQYMNHIRPFSLYSPHLSGQTQLERVGSAFNKASHTVEVRRIASSRGRYNIANIGLFVWRLNAYRHTFSPAVRVGQRRYIISALGNNSTLFSRARVNDGLIDQLSGPENISEPLSRIQMNSNLASYYGFRETAAAPVDNESPSIVLQIEGDEIARDRIRICNLSDSGEGWAHQPPDGFFAIDPVLGRVALPADWADPADVRLLYHQGFSADMAGGEYERAINETEQTVTVASVPDDFATIAQAIDSLSGHGVVEINDNGHYQEQLDITVVADASIELRARNGRNPHLELTAPLSITGAQNSRLLINGFLISADGLRVNNENNNQLAHIDIQHCTLVPGRSLDIQGQAVQPQESSIVVDIPDISLHISQCICGALRIHENADVEIADSIVDATAMGSVVFSGVDGQSVGGSLSVTASTLIGKIHAREFGTVSNSILLARLNPADSWESPVHTQRKQTGCVRFSFLPFDAIVPKRYRCQPDSVFSARRIAPRFTSLVYGDPAYAQLAATTDDVIKRGAEDESEMGAFHSLYAPQREINLQVRLQEYLRVGLDAGIFYSS